MSRIRRGSRRGQSWPMSGPEIFVVTYILPIILVLVWVVIVGGVILGIGSLMAAALAFSGHWAQLGRRRTASPPSPRQPDDPTVLLGPEEFAVLQVVSSDEAAHCPVCASELGAAPVVACPRCATPHHRDCWEFNGACAVFGCGVAEPCSATSLSPVSSSPSSAPSLPPSDAFLALRRRFRRWFWVTRAQWWSLLALSMLLCVVALLHTLGVLDGWDVLTGPIMALGAFSALLLTLSVLASRRLEGSLQGAPVIPPQRLAGLVRRMEHSRSQPVLSRMARWFPAVYGFVAVGVVVFVLHAGARSACRSVVVLASGFVFALVARWSVRRHAMSLNMIRWRLHRHRTVAEPERGRP